MRKQPLTEKQRDTLRFITQFIEERKMAPSLLEIGKHFNLTAKSSVWQRLIQLEARGWIKRKKGHPRYIKVI